MASTFFGLTISYSGLQAASTSLNVTGHNVSNINTKGYSKQQASTEAAQSLRTFSTYGMLGAGVKVTGVSQLRDSYYDEKYRNNQANYGEYEAKENYMDQKVYQFDRATIGENSIIPDGVKIGKNTAIAGETTVGDYPDGLLASGNYIIKAGGVK